MLKKIGEVLHISRDRKIVAKLTTSTLPPLYITVFDYGMRRVGVLFDIIGPVKSPYALIKPDPQLSDPNEVVGKAVYVREVDLRRKGREYGQRRR